MNEVAREKLTSDFKALLGDVEELLKSTSSQAARASQISMSAWGKSSRKGKKL